MAFIKYHDASIVKNSSTEEKEEMKKFAEQSKENNKSKNGSENK